MMSASTRRRQLWLAVGPAMVVPCLGALAYFVLFQESALVKALYGFSKAFTLAWPVVAFAVILQEQLPRPALSRRDLRALRPGLATGILIGSALLGLCQTGLGKVIAEGAPAIHSQAERFGILEHYWLFGWLLSTVHSLLEEYYWRWFVYGQIRRGIGPRAAHVLAAAAFAAHHVVITGVYFGWGWGLCFGVGVGVGGVIWSQMYERQGTLAGAWVSHLIVDLAILSVGHHALWGTWL
jgi:hypothetical protein